MTWMPGTWLHVSAITRHSRAKCRDVPHLRVHGKGSRTRPMPIHLVALSALDDEPDKPAA